MDPSSMDPARCPVDLESTVLIPRPGGRRAPASAAAPLPSQPQPSPLPPEPDDRAPPVGLNPLVAQAAGLLGTVPTIRRTLRHADPAALRVALLRGIAEFEQRARAAGAGPEHVLIGRYALCTVIDEAVASMPWGASPEWARQSLLVTLHREGFGGEKFFQLLDKAMEDPCRNIDLLELMYVCLALGFEGRYSLADNGHAQLERVRERLHIVIRRERGEFERELSGHWQGRQRRPAARVRRLSAWIVLAAVAVPLCACYTAFALVLAGRSDPVFGALAAIRPQPGDVQRVPPPAAAPVAPRLKPLLAAAILADRLEVNEDATSSHVIIHGDKFFDPGSAEIRPELLSVVGHIAAAIDQVPGVVLVSGHTDDQPMRRSLRFPSNYELSLERARGVAALLAQAAPGHAIRSEGLADSQPLASNATPQGRARNRRVEITLRRGA